MKACIFIKKRLQGKCFFYVNITFYRTPPATASVKCSWSWVEPSMFDPKYADLFPKECTQKRGFYTPSRKFWISFYGMNFKFSSEVYSRARNKCLGTLINFVEKFHPSHVYSNMFIPRLWEFETFSTHSFYYGCFSKKNH